MADNIETLLGFSCKEDTIAITVVTTGGTDQGSFDFDVNCGITNEGPCLFTVRRITIDTGKMMPRELTLTYSRAQLQIKKHALIEVQNRFRSI